MNIEITSNYYRLSVKTNVRPSHLYNYFNPGNMELSIEFFKVLIRYQYNAPIKIINGRIFERRKNIFI
jgi:hypothetical protein